MKKYLNFIIAVFAVLVCSLLAFTSLDFKIADYFQRPMKPLNESQKIVMVAVDDMAVDNIGNWPFSREVYAGMNTVLKDLQADSVVYDLSFLDKSVAKVDEEYLNDTLPQYIDNGFDMIDSSLQSTLSYICGEEVTEEMAAEFEEYLLGVTQTVKNDLSTSISKVSSAADAVLADSLATFGNSYLTLTFEDGAIPSDEELDYLSTYIALDNIEIEDDSNIPEKTGLYPAIYEFMTRSRRAGFVNTDPDKDGFFRRVNLIVKYNGKYYGQLVFVPILRMYGNPKVIVKKNSIILKNAKVSDTEIKDIKIPRDRFGSVLLKYPKKVFDKYDNVISLWNIYRISLLEEQLFEYLKYIGENGLFEYWEGNNPLELMGNIYWFRDALKYGEDTESGIDSDNYKFTLNSFYDAIKAFAESNIDEWLLEPYGIDSEDDVEFYHEIMSVCKECYDEYITAVNRVGEKVKYSICVVGTNASSTTDYGINQYQEHYPSPGVHYTLANQLINEDFVDDSPVWLGIVIALVFCLAYAFIAKQINSTGKQIIAGIILMASLAIVLFIVFMITKTYIGFLIPVVSLFVDFTAISIEGFLSTSHEKRFIQNAFSQCLSKEVVNDIVANPSSFKLGGQRLEMTAMFTDIQKFSGFSELLSASQLVALLNYYLTKMSDIIMEERGTVDKYEGDAIIALVGAPVKMEDHAQRACAAAINMKKAEVLMNEEIARIASEQKPDEMEQDLYDAFTIMVKNNRNLFTRIGLNSGEMIAGYMGSENKKNYTMMGNNVNLASRLEGVNKQYSTGGIMISDATRKLIGDRFVVRSLDRVQVVNVKTPIRIYELIDEVSNADEKLIKYVEAWEKTMKVFESGDYKKALEYFQKLLEIRPEDNTAKYYIKLLENFFILGTYPDEMSDIGVAYNPENPEDMDPSWIGTPFEIKGTFRLLQK